MNIPFPRPLTACLGPAVLSVGLMLACTAQAQVPETADNWRLSLGWQHYSEPEMRLQGPEVGLHWRRQSADSLQWEADALLGLQNYSSDRSGTLNEVLNIDTRWRVLNSSSAWPQLAYGLALHTHFNNLRGVTSLGFGGYDRISTQLWLPVRWNPAQAPTWAFDAGVLLWGQHVSRLSQVGPGNDDVRNVQRSGLYLQASTTVASMHGTFVPFLRWAWVDNSNEEVARISGVIQRAYEPRHNRVSVGVQWVFQ